MISIDENTGNGTGQPLLQARGLSKTYGHVEALRSVDIDLYAGQIHAIVGDNGVGKSTLLRMLAGAMAPDVGEIRLDGEPITLESPLHARELGIETVYQDLSLASDRSCTANVYLGRELKRGGLLGLLGILDRKKMNERTATAFRDLSIPITDVVRPVRLFSGGQQQGVAIARAAIWATRVILLDEPTAALGVRQQAAVRSLIENLRSRGLAVVLVSHDIPTVLSIADHLTILRLGGLVTTRHCEGIDTSWVVEAMVQGATV